jgi:hypothetical protein
MHLTASRARRGALGIGAALLLSAAGVGMVAAQQTPDATSTPSGQQAPRPGPRAFLDALASRLGITPDTLQQAITDARTDVGAPDVGPGSRGGFPFPGHGWRGPGPGVALDAAAPAIGITSDQLRQELSGSSLSAVAQAHGKDPADVANALKAAANTRIDQAVADNRLTADQAARIKDETAQRIDQLMTATRPAAGADRPGRGMHPDGFGGPGRRGPWPQGTPTPQA